MKRFIPFLLLICIITTAHTQIRLPGTHVSFDFPGNGWSYLKTMNIDKNTDIHLYVYSKQAIIDSTGDTILPFLRIYVRKNYTDNAFSLAYSRYMQQPFQSLNEYVDGLPSEGIGYVGAYHSPSDKKDYQFRMIYFKDKNTALEFRAETTCDTYPLLDAEFQTIFQTIKLENK